MPVQKLDFEGSNGAILRGILHISDTPGSPFAIFAHCFTCSKDLIAVKTIASEISQNGVSVLRFDFTGLGESEGDFPDTSFTTNVSDLIYASEFLAANYSPVQLLIGHSLGGAAVLQAAGEIPSCTAVVTISSPSEPSHVLKLFKEDIKEIEKRGEGNVEIEGREFKIKKQFIDDLEKNNMNLKISNLKKALLVMHSPIDNVVGIDNASNIFLPAKHPKSFISLDNADHLLSKSEDAKYVGSVISSWSKRFLTADAENTVPENADDEGAVVVINEKHSYTSRIYNGDHIMIADEPESKGGDDQGPDPYTYLLGSLGSCTAITLRMYSKRKNIPLEDIRVILRHRKVHASDCEECETVHGKVDYINRDLELSGDLTGEQRSKLLDIADKCPVHRTLHSEIVIKTRLV